jgi:transposase-like protein
VNNLKGRDFLPDVSSLRLRGIEQGSDGWVVEASASSVSACPDCGVSSTARHSRYWRQLKDLPIQGRCVRLKLRVGRWMEAETVRQRRQERQMLFQTVKEMQAAGLRISEIARHLGVNRRRLDKWVRLDTLPARELMQPRPGMAESFRDYFTSEEANVRKSGIRATSITSSALGGVNEPAPNLRKNLEGKLDALGQARRLFCRLGHTHIKLTSCQNSTIAISTPV